VVVYNQKINSLYKGVVKFAQVLKLMTKQYILKTVELAKVQITCHDQALAAYEHSRLIKTYAKTSAITKLKSHEKDDNLISVSQTFNPLFVVQTMPKELAFYAGWRWFELCQLAGISKILVIECRDVSSIDVAKNAWQYLFSDHVFDMTQADSLMQMVKLFKVIPKEYLQVLLASDYSHSALKSVENMTGVSRQTIRSQLESLPKFEETKTSILDMLLSDGG